MEHCQRRTEPAAVCGVRPGLSQLKGRTHHDHGVTLVELLAALAISCVIISVVLYTGNYEETSWKELTTTSSLKSDVRFADQKLEQVFQNLTDVKLDVNYPVHMIALNGSSVPAGTAVTGTDSHGQTVEVCVQQPGPATIVSGSGTAPASVVENTGSMIIITYTPNGANAPSRTVKLPAVNTTFAGTVFVVNGRLVTTNYNVETIGQSNTAPYQLSVTYVTEGGY